MSEQYLVIYCTCPDSEIAEQVASTLVDEGLAACVNIVPGLVSIYCWQGERQRDSEVLLIIKSRQTSYDALEARIQALHPYDVPEVIALPIVRGATEYLAWLDSQIGS
ncbi:MAG: divalent-cation tolerance protein CutA [Candidatus Competibacteraceae bacterium]|jgi:periplasmic divalent cation tolerance protein|nr:divalent-cation tolerance protein CutA [Candidatus Competibacteraceae bacterium]